MPHLINFLASWAHIPNFQAHRWTLGPCTAVRWCNGGRTDTRRDATIGWFQTLPHNHRPAKWLAVLSDRCLRPGWLRWNMPELFASYAAGTPDKDSEMQRYAHNLQISMRRVLLNILKGHLGKLLQVLETCTNERPARCATATNGCYSAQEQVTCKYRVSLCRTARRDVA